MSGKPSQASLEEQVAVLRAQLEQAQRMTALGELSGTIAHELNNVLMKLVGYAQMGLRHKDDMTRQRAFETILSISQRTKKMLTSILALARNRPADRAPTDLAALVDDTLLLLERELNKHRVSVEKDFHPVPPALVSGNQIQQVLINLLINARQAMPDGGRLILRLRHDSAAGLVELTVRDTGTGIPADKLPHIFDPFFTTKKPDATGKGGTGLGLSTCRTLIEANQGRVRVESTVGKGTAFILKLPAAPDTAPPPHDSSAAGRPAPISAQNMSADPAMQAMDRR